MESNKSKTYILPLFSTIINLKFIQNILNTYTHVENLYDDEKIFIISYKFINSPEFIQYENEIKNSKYYLTTIDDENNVNYVFKIPDSILYEYNKFLQGLYSEFREEKKRTILIFFIKLYSKITPIYEEVFGVLYKTIERKNKIEKTLNIKLNAGNELSAKPDKEKETYKFKKLCG